ncbi:P-loop containing nucleoside triphosphate hydrolase protein [Rostrohypoxylon terebratum]|nr:P-loop containing nucleoside triphosphate hydrolase protein [Rostrohypoxylon terebratum]
MLSLQGSFQGWRFVTCGPSITQRKPARYREIYFCYPRQQITDGLNTSIKNHSVMVYAIDTDDPKVVELLLQYGPRLDGHSDGIPLLAFAIMRGIRTGHTNPEIIKLLLAHGADPLVIPQAMWQDYTKTPTIASFEQTPASEWCDDNHKHVLLKTLGLSTRYYLWRAHQIGKVEPEKLKIGATHNVNSLFKLPFQLVGQDLSVKLVVDTIFAHITQNIKKPLVLAFAGTSGLGKTELANQIGSLLSVPFITLDCNHLNSTWWLLGNEEHQWNNKLGAPLNNFLADNAGKRCVVLLDDFDKMNTGMKETLLKMLDEGVYHDRRVGDNKHSEIDCQKVIWLLTTTIRDSSVVGLVDIITSIRNDSETAASVSLKIIRRCFEIYIFDDKPTYQYAHIPGAIHFKIATRTR